MTPKLPQRITVKFLVAWTISDFVASITACKWGHNGKAENL